MALIDVVSYVKRGSNRKKVLLALDKPMMPSELVVKIYGKSSNTHFNIVSRALSELLKKKLVELENPAAITGRIYRKTELAGRVLKHGL